MGKLDHGELMWVVMCDRGLAGRILGVAADGNVSPDQVMVCLLDVGLEFIERLAADDRELFYKLARR